LSIESRIAFLASTTVAPVRGRLHVWSWFYVIRGAGDRLIKRDGGFNTELEAIAAGRKYLRNNKATVIRPEHPDESFAVKSEKELIGGSQ
jgi:hypothetical protein